MKILGSDYDGTLTEGGFGKEKIIAIDKWRTAGNLFGIVSGRNGDFLKTLSHDIPNLKLDFFIACNGGYITDGNGKIIYERRCELSILAIIKDLFSWGCKFIHLNRKRYSCIVENMDDVPFFIPKEQACLLKQIPPIDYFNQISVELSSTEISSVVTKMVYEKYKKWLNPLQNGRCIDIVPLGVNKAEGLYRIMEFFGCTHKDVIAVGDNFNDLDMLREFRSYAMANGVDEIKAIANDIVNDVTDLIEKELLNN